MFGAFIFILGLVAVNAVWPQGFTVFIAIGGTLGALMVLYEVRLTKQIAQAEFIRDLQTSFASDPNITELWKKLLLEEEIIPEDRALMSSYLTFFETVHLLQSRGAIDLSLIDELFRNRFFTAVGHPVVLRQTLVKSVGAFTNIHSLINAWYEHLINSKKPVHQGYYSYVRAVIEAKGFSVRELGTSDLGDLLDLQEHVLSALGDKPWLRSNPAQAFAECLDPKPSSEASGVSPDRVPGHHVVGAFRGEQLVAAAILFDAGAGNESIKRYLTGEEEDGLEDAINLKLVLADPAHRRHKLGASLIKLLEQRAYELGRREILCTIHPQNVPSARLFSGLGYRKSKKVATSYGTRHVYVRTLKTIDAHWIR